MVTPPAVEREPANPRPSVSQEPIDLTQDDDDDSMVVDRSATSGARYPLRSLRSKQPEVAPTRTSVNSATSSGMRYGHASKNEMRLILIFL